MVRVLRYTSVLSLLLALIAAGYFISRLDRCIIDTFVPAGTPPPPFFVTFLGVSTLLIDDGTDAILIDGYFSRPVVGLDGAAQILPDDGKIEAALGTAQITTSAAARALRLAGVVVNHSHFDHAMDAPEVVMKTDDALLVGSATTANIGRGRANPVPEQRLRIFSPTGESRFCLGRFRVTAVRTGHLQVGGDIPHAGEIATPSNPQTVAGYVEGGTWTIFIRRRDRTLMVQGSAGFAEGALQGRRADVVYLAVGGLTLTSAAYRANYWNETVGTVMPQRIYFIHWDALGGPLTDDPSTSGSLDLALAGALSTGIEPQRPPVGMRIEPFSGL
jgi:L-ascorbate metabolism protein UlaG (beta-lactamase superfamily)